MSIRCISNDLVDDVRVPTEGYEDHVFSVDDNGEMDLRDHSNEDVDGQSVISALGGRGCTCVELLSAWHKGNFDKIGNIIRGRHPQPYDYSNRMFELSKFLWFMFSPNYFDGYVSHWAETSARIAFIKDRYHLGLSIILDELENHLGLMGTSSKKYLNAMRRFLKNPKSVDIVGLTNKKRHYYFHEGEDTFPVKVQSDSRKIAYSVHHAALAARVMKYPITRSAGSIMDELRKSLEELISYYPEGEQQQEFEARIVRKIASGVIRGRWRRQK